jgi:hypothetical protein
MNPSASTASQSRRVKAVGDRPAHTAMARKKGSEKSMRSASNVITSTSYWYASLMMIGLPANAIEPMIVSAVPM